MAIVRKTTTRYGNFGIAFQPRLTWFYRDKAPHPQFVAMNSC